jgi:hypothetical protein
MAGHGRACVKTQRKFTLRKTGFSERAVFNYFGCRNGPITPKIETGPRFHTGSADSCPLCTNQLAGPMLDRSSLISPTNTKAADSDFRVRFSHDHRGRPLPIMVEKYEGQDMQIKSSLP